MNNHPEKTHLTILVDNRAGSGLQPEFGLSLWIQASGRKMLFDTGAGQALAPNAEHLNVDLAQTEILVLSHGHYDHGGGIPAVLRHAPGAHLYLHPGALACKYSLDPGQEPRAVGLPLNTLQALEMLPPDQMHRIQEPIHLTQEVGLSGTIPRVTPFEEPLEPFFLDQTGHTPDQITDDLALYLKTETGLVVCLGCAHAGVINTLKHITEISGEQNVRALIGGMHLQEAGDRHLEQIIDALEDFSPDVLVPCHCTGEKAERKLQDRFPGKVFPGYSGRVLEF